MKGTVPCSCLPTRLSRQSLDVLHKSRAVKIDWPEAVCHNRPLPIDHIGGRHVTRPEFPGNFHARVYRGGKGIATFGDERLHHLLSTAVDRYGQHHHILALKGVMYPLHGGHLALADGSPSRPESYHYDLTA